MRIAARSSDADPDPEGRPRLIVREAEPSHLAAIRAALILSYYEYQAVLPPQVFSAYLGDLLDLESRMASGQLLAAWRGSRVLGTVTYYPESGARLLGWPAGWVSVRALGVTPQARGTGVGRRLMEECLARASAAGAKGMGLHTADFMYEAVRLYWRLGFRPAPVFDFQVPAGHAGHPAGDPSAPTAHAYVRSLP